MSEYSSFRERSDIKKFYTESNMKTNTSFELSQSTHVNDFNFMNHESKSIVENSRESSQHSNIYIKDNQVSNNSSLPLQPSVTSQQVNQLFTIMNMINFYDAQSQEKQYFIAKKTNRINQLYKLVQQMEYKTLKQKQIFQRKREKLNKMKLLKANFKKKISRILTQETLEMKYYLNIYNKVQKTKRSNTFYQAHQSNSFINIKQGKAPKRRKIYIPIPHQSDKFVNPYQNANPYYAKSYQQKSQYVSNHSYIVEETNQRTTQKKPVILAQLKQALTMKFKIEDQEPRKSNPANKFDYFDQSVQQKSRNSNEQGDKRASNSPKSIIRRSGSSRWKKDDNQDKQLVEIITKSITNIKNDDQCHGRGIQESRVMIEQSQAFAPFKIETLKIDKSKRYSDSSEINISIQSQEKRNSKSFSQKEDNYTDKKKQIINKSDKKDKNKQIQQSNIKIDMSISKNSASSKSDSSKHAANRYIPSLNENFQQIEEQSEEIASLRATPIENKLKNSSQIKRKQQLAKSNQISPKNSIRSPPILKGRQQLEQEDLLTSIKLDMQSKISRRSQKDKNIKHNKEEEQYGDDILDSINLLKQSRTSRQKALSMKNSMMKQIIPEQQEDQKGSKSQIFSNMSNELSLSEINSSLSNTNSKIIKHRKASNLSDIGKKGKTEPLMKGHLKSIPSMQIQQDQNESLRSSIAKARETIL